MIELMRISESLDCWYSNKTFRVSSSFLSRRLESIPKFSYLSTFSTSSSSRISSIYSLESLIISLWKIKTLLFKIYINVLKNFLNTHCRINHFSFKLSKNKNICVIVIYSAKISQIYFLIYVFYGVTWITLQNNHAQWGISNIY